MAATPLNFTAKEKDKMRQLVLNIALDKWGPAWWRMSNAIVFGPKCVPAWVCSYLHASSNLLLCVECQGHLREYLLAHPPEEATNCAEMQKYVVELHNSVSRRLGKEEMTVEQARQLTLQSKTTTADWWLFALATATLYNPESQQEFMCAFLEEACNLLPQEELCDALEKTSLDVTSAQSLVRSLLQAEGVTSYKDYVANYVPPQLYTQMGVTPEEQPVLHAGFLERVEGVKELQAAARVRAAMKPAKLSLFTIIWITVAVTFAIIAIILAIVFIYRKSKLINPQPRS